MRITRDYGLTSSKLEHDLLARLDRDIAREYMISAENKCSVNKVKMDANVLKALRGENIRMYGRKI